MINAMVRSVYVEQLTAFHAKYEHVMNDTPTIPSRKTKELRIKLLREELAELVKAIKDDDMVEIADGIADLLYVTFGVATTYGIPIDPIFGEVHSSNMTKPMKKDKIGKTIKGPEFEPPKIREILERYGWRK